jgi:hypothetical protein
MRLVKPKLTGEAERATQTSVDTIEVTRKLASAWKSPPFQREVRITSKVQLLATELQRDGVLPGVLTLGVFDGDVYVVDGQHRLHAFMMTELDAVYADVRWHHFESMGAMADEFVRLNSSLVRLRPDDILKGLEQSNVFLQRVRRKCPYVGYDAVRRGSHAPVVSMSTLLRCWFGSRTDVPAVRIPATTAAEQLNEEEANLLIAFLALAFEAWHRDKEYAKLWGALNLTLCMWLYRRVVLAPATRTGRATRLTADEFKRGLLSLSAASEYLEYLVGRNLGDKDRAPAYNRLKAILVNRYRLDHGGQQLLLPQPPWAHG